MWASHVKDIRCHPPSGRVGQRPGRVHRLVRLSLALHPPLAALDPPNGRVAKPDKLESKDLHVVTQIAVVREFCFNPPASESEAAGHRQA